MILAIAKVSHSEMNYEVSLFFRQRWIDDRLTNIFKGNETLLLDSSMEKKIWKPDLLFKHEEVSRRHMFMADQKLVEISPSGRVMYSEQSSKLAKNNDAMLPGQHALLR